MTVTRTRKTTTQSRPGPKPTSGQTLHLIGDVHAGGIPQWRLDTVVDDLHRWGLNPSAHIQLGDNTDNGLAAENTVFAAFKAKFTDSPFYMAQGNHDLFNQTPAQWATQWGLPSNNYVQQIGGITLIFIGWPTGLTAVVTSGTLSFLDSALTAAGSSPCFIVSHFPLWDTVLGDPTLEASSLTDGIYITGPSDVSNSASILAVLASHSNVAGWLSGHTHSHIDVPGLVVPVMAGSHKIIHVNASCIYYCGKASGPVGGPNHPLNTLAFTYYGGRAEVRFRDHGGGSWLGPAGQRVISVSGIL